MRYYYGAQNSYHHGDTNKQAGLKQIRSSCGLVDSYNRRNSVSGQEIQKEKTGSLIVEEDTVYEIDEICMRNFSR